MADDEVHSAVLTVRLIRSFEYRTVKNLILTGIDLEKTTVGQLKELIAQKIATPALKTYQSMVFDTLKIYTKAHGAKSQNLVINFENDDWVLSNNEETLLSRGIENETELSYFNLEAYEKYKSDPQVKW